ncbi:MAG TPA: hypothetical protein GXX28_00415, partial [Firmicutes bacterium]|nr:hypothetical protein [Bacillota bacterium]
THSVEQAQRVAGHVLALLGGRVADEASAAEFFARPREELLALYHAPSPAERSERP